MKLNLVAVGKARNGPEQKLFDHYCARMPVPLQLREVEEKKKLSGDELKRREAELLLGAVPPGAVVIALDERGENPKSTLLAEKIGRWRDEGRAELVFLIGGADGLDEQVRARADYLLSFGKMTWPHMLVRAMLAEQIYRALSILAGHPYHRE